MNEIERRKYIKKRFKEMQERLEKATNEYIEELDTIEEKETGKMIQHMYNDELNIFKETFLFTE